MQQRLEAEPELKAKTLFDWLQDNYVGRFPVGDNWKSPAEPRLDKYGAQCLRLSDN